MGSKLGASKIAAKKVGLSVGEYLTKINGGLKWCYRCQQWKSLSNFPSDRTRMDGKDARCFDCRRKKEYAPNYRKFPSSKGVKRSVLARQHYSEMQRGPKNHRWKGGITPLQSRERATPESRAWKKAVIERDFYKCRMCQAKGEIVAHHIKSWSAFPHLRHSLSNGITLCVKCHKFIHKHEKRNTGYSA